MKQPNMGSLVAILSFYFINVVSGEPPSIPSVEFGDIMARKVESITAMKSALFAHGIVRVDNVPNYASCQSRAIGDHKIYECTADSTVLEHSNKFFNMDLRSVNAKPTCAMPETGLRSLMDSTGRQIILSLEFLKDGLQSTVEPSLSQMYESGQYSETLNFYGEDHKANAEQLVVENFDSTTTLFSLISMRLESSTNVGASSFIQGCSADSSRFRFINSDTNSILVVITSEGHKWLRTYMALSSDVSTSSSNSCDAIQLPHEMMTAHIHSTGRRTWYARHYPLPSSNASTSPVVEMDMDDAGSGSSSFCSGPGTTMSMTGFFSQSSTKNPPCINFLVDSATLDTQAKFAVGCLGVFLMALLVQLLSRVRMEVNRAYKLGLRRGSPKRTNGSGGGLAMISKVANFASPSSPAGSPAATKPLSSLAKQVINFLLIGIQLTLAYALMLICMTYCGELFAMTVLGLTGGYAAFHVHIEEHTSHTTDPCCDAENELVGLDVDGGGVEHLN